MISHDSEKSGAGIVLRAGCPCKTWSRMRDYDTMRTGTCIPLVPVEYRCRRLAIRAILSRRSSWEAHRRWAAARANAPGWRSACDSHPPSASYPVCLAGIHWHKICIPTIMGEHDAPARRLLRALNVGRGGHRRTLRDRAWQDTDAIAEPRIERRGGRTSALARQGRGHTCRQTGRRHLAHVAATY
jgi:hypothetical protein